MRGQPQAPIDTHHPSPRGRHFSGTTVGRCALALAACAVVSGCGAHRPRSSASPAGKPVVAVLSPAARIAAGGDARPNIVLILTDDLSPNLVQFMPHVRALERRGATFGEYFVSDSLCCPSRASLLTGALPHNNGVLQNFGASGGVDAFHRYGDEKRTFALALRRGGYRTALIGKYLNGYLQLPGRQTDGAHADLPSTYIPPGWSQWDVAGWGYPEFNYTLNQNGVLHRYGHRASDYLTDVISRLGIGFINQSATARRPFFLELATFAPHSPYVPAPRDAHAFPGVKAPRPPSFDRLPLGAARWLVGHRRMSDREIASINYAFRLRVQSVQAVDRMLGEVEQALVARHLEHSTYIVFTSDNGLHMGEYRLLPGKQTAYDTDIRVPLIVAGPGIPPDSRTSALAENIDLAETFAAMARLGFAGDGHSLLPVLTGRRPQDWRAAVLIEHDGPDTWGGDPDYQRAGAGNPRSYEAMRAARFLYVEYGDGEREYYDLRLDPFELRNLAARLSRRRLAELHRELTAMERCHGAGQCWRAMHL